MMFRVLIEIFTSITEKKSILIEHLFRVKDLSCARACVITPRTLCRDGGSQTKNKSKEEKNVLSTGSEEICSIEGDGIDFEYVGPYLYEPDAPITMFRNMEKEDRTRDPP